jgi:hypothetical protein
MKTERDPDKLMRKASSFLAVDILDSDRGQRDVS